MLTKQFVQTKVADNYYKATHNEFSDALNKASITSKLIINNIFALIKSFPNSSIRPIKKREDRAQFGFSHILINEYNGDYNKPSIGYYITSAVKYEFIPNCAAKDCKVILRDELVEEWKHGYIPGLFILHKEIDSDTVVYQKLTPDYVKSIVCNKLSSSYKDDAGYAWNEYTIPDIWEIVPDEIDEKCTPFNFKFLPSFLSIAKAPYSKFRNGGKEIYINTYFGTLATESFKYRSFREAAAALQRIGVSISYRTLMRYYKSGKPFKLESSSQYDYITISDKPNNEDLKETAIEKVTVFSHLSNKAIEIETKVVDTKEPENIEITSDDVEIIDIDDNETTYSLDTNIQDSVIEQTWTHPSIYDKPDKVIKLDLPWLEWRKLNPGKNYEQYLCQTHMTTK